MSEWWTYRLSDFLMFSPRTYYGLFEQASGSVWPAQWAAFALGLAMLVLARARPAWTRRAAWLILAAAWAFVAWAYFARHFATVHTAGDLLAGVFAVQASLLVAAGAAAPPAPVARPPSGPQWAGACLSLYAVCVHPAAGLAWGRPWAQAETFGLAPDPTAIATLGMLLWLQPAFRRPRVAWMLWPVPLAWCLASAATLWTLQAPDAWVPAAAAMLAAGATLWRPLKPPQRP